MRLTWLVLGNKGHKQSESPDVVTEGKLERQSRATLKETVSVFNYSVTATPWTTAPQTPLSMGILQVRIQEWVAMPSSRGSSKTMD